MATTTKKKSKASKAGKKIGKVGKASLSKAANKVSRAGTYLTAAAVVLRTANKMGDEERKSNQAKAARKSIAKRRAKKKK